MIWWVRRSSAARPTVDDRVRAIGFSSRYCRYSSGVSPDTRETRNMSPSARNSWAAVAPHSRAAYSTMVSRTVPGLATSRPRAARISRLAADCSRASSSSSRSTAADRLVLGAIALSVMGYRPLLAVVMVVHAPTWMRSPSASWDLLAVAQEVVAVVEGGPVGRTQVGDGEPGVPDPQHGMLGGHAAVGRDGWPRSISGSTPWSRLRRPIRLVFRRSMIRRSG